MSVSRSMPVCSLKCAAPSLAPGWKRRELAAHLGVHHVAHIGIGDETGVGGHVSEFGGSVPPNHREVLESADVGGNETRAQAHDEDS